jgi:hypothetical protein
VRASAYYRTVLTISLYGPNFCVHDALLHSVRFINNSALRECVSLLQYLNVSILSIYIHEIKFYEQCGGVWLEAARSDVGGGFSSMSFTDVLLGSGALWERVPTCGMVLGLTKIGVIHLS